MSINAALSAVARIVVNARAKRTGAKKLISMFWRRSASVTSRRLAVGGIPPALLIRIVTSSAMAAAAAIEAGSVTSRVSGTMRSSSH